jgi:Fic family protein
MILSEDHEGCRHSSSERVESLIETPGRIEPVLLADEDCGAVLFDLVRRVREASGMLVDAVHPSTTAALREVVRISNAQHSNAIEGHYVSADSIGSINDADRSDSLIAELFAHVSAEECIDRLLIERPDVSPTSIEFIEFAHRTLYRFMPEQFLGADSSGQNPIIRPGEFRKSRREDVSVGRHVPPSSERVEDFMRHFAERLRMGVIGPSASVLALAAAHHRFAFIHPFVDGNGRVARFMTHAMASQAGIGAQGLWSIARALNVSGGPVGHYVRMVDHADAQRRGDRDGRGNLSAAALREFSEWFMESILKEIEFASALFDVGAIAERFPETVVGPAAKRVFVATLQNGPSDVERLRAVIGIEDASIGIEALTAEGLATSDGFDGRISISFPLKHCQALFPELLLEVEAPVNEHVGAHRP